MAYTKKYPNGWRNKGQGGALTPFNADAGNHIEDGIAAAAATADAAKAQVDGRLSEQALTATIADVVAQSGVGGPRQQVNILTYGGVGNSTGTGNGTDNTAALLAAKNAAVALVASTGFPVDVYIPAGRYRFLSGVGSWPSKVGVVGDGIGRTIIAPEGSGYTLFAKKGGPGSPMVSNEFAHFTIDGIGLTNGTGGYDPEHGKGIFFQYMFGAYFHDLHIVDTIATGLGVDFLARGSVIERVTVERCGRGYSGNFSGNIGASGIGIGTRGAWTEIEDLVVRNSMGLNNKNCGLFDEDQGMGGPITGTTYINCIAIGNHSGYESKNSNAKFIGCIGERNLLYGIHVTDAAVIEGGSYSRNGDGTDPLVGDGIRMSRQGTTYGAPTIRGRVVADDNNRYGVNVYYTSVDARMDVPLGGITARRNKQSGVAFTSNNPTSVHQPILLGDIVAVDNGGSRVSERRSGVSILMSTSALYASGGYYGDTGVGDQERAIRVTGSTITVGTGEITRNTAVGITAVNAFAVQNTASAAAVRISRNAGFPTEGRGSATINAGAMTATVAHGLKGTPAVANPIATSATAPQLIVTAKSATSFTVSRPTGAATTDPVTFDWSAEV